MLLHRASAVRRRNSRRDAHRRASGRSRGRTRRTRARAGRRSRARGAASWQLLTALEPRACERALWIAMRELVARRGRTCAAARAIREIDEDAEHIEVVRRARIRRSELAEAALCTIVSDRKRDPAPEVRPG